jgi:hypothetical protein
MRERMTAILAMEFSVDKVDEKSLPDVKQHHGSTPVPTARERESNYYTCHCHETPWTINIYLPILPGSTLQHSQNKVLISLMSQSIQFIKYFSPNN